MPDYSNHMQECCWHLRSHSDDLTKEKDEELMDGAQVGSVDACHPSGWVQMDIFTT
jgi:hypothetical protein